MRIAYAVISLMLVAPVSWAGNMTFQFRNPNFGGNPNNGAFLLNEARHKTPIKIQALKL
jgi:curli production assembly/transport component CsgF